MYFHFHFGATSCILFDNYLKIFIFEIHRGRVSQSQPVVRVVTLAMDIPTGTHNISGATSMQSTYYSASVPAMCATGPHYSQA